MRSISIIGTEKNTGKTETLNWLLRQLKESGKTVVVTSVGIDGESIDAITATPKPEITIFENMMFVTTENFFLNKKFSAEVLDVVNGTSIFGRLVTAKAKNEGKILLSGAADTFSLKKIIAKNAALGADLSVVDGALFRKSLASPAITDGVILATGAAFSANIDTLVKKTKYVCTLIDLPQAQRNLADTLTAVESGIWTIDNGVAVDLNINSGLNISTISAENIEKIGQTKILFAAGILSDKIIDFLFEKNILRDILLIVKDFTNVFLSEAKYDFLQKMGGKVEVLQHTNLLAVTINPTSPQGYTLASDVLAQKLQQEVKVPVFDVLKNSKISIISKLQ